MHSVVSASLWTIHQHGKVVCSHSITLLSPTAFPGHADPSRLLSSAFIRKDTASSQIWTSTSLLHGLEQSYGRMK